MILTIIFFVLLLLSIWLFGYSIFWKERDWKMAFIAFLAIVFFWLINWRVYLTTDYYEWTVTKTEIKKQDWVDKYMVWFNIEKTNWIPQKVENKAFTIEDSVYYLQFRSSDLYWQITEGQEYKIWTSWFRVPLMSWYENIFSVDSIVQDTKVTSSKNIELSNKKTNSIDTNAKERYFYISSIVFLNDWSTVYHNFTTSTENWKYLNLGLLYWKIVNKYWVENISKTPYIQNILELSNKDFLEFNKK